MKTPLQPQSNYQNLVNTIAQTLEQGRNQAARAVNTQLLQTYWQIGQYIVEYEQNGQDRATYGKLLINNLAIDLSQQHGKGFSRSNLIYMRLLYLKYPISEKPSHLLSWSHYVELLKIENDLERSFYEKQSINENWSIPELKRQKKASLFLRLATSKDKDEIKKLSENGRRIRRNRPNEHVFGLF
jgi:predicted nuclease of restriction endonuclease-like (RecB) superfamily